MDCGKLLESEFFKQKIRTFTKSRDVDQDGLITRMDFELLVKQFKERGVPEEHVKLTESTFFKFCDDMGLTDAAKSLSYDQFAEQFCKIAEKSLKIIPRFYKSTFEVIDTDHDGFLSYVEWEDYNLAVRIASEHSKASFEAMDTDHDGRISMEEFVAYHEEFFYSTEDRLNSSILFGPLVK